jgi:hypothetical protein
MSKFICVFIIIIYGYAQQGVAAQISACQEELCIEYFNKFNSFAKRGHPVAMATLGQLYYYGYGTKKNDELALSFLLRSAKLGNVAANYKAGLMYINSKKESDVNEGIIHLEKASRKRYKNANFILGVVYLSEKFGLHNPSLADKYLAKSYKQKHPKIPSVVDHINESMTISENNFPLLFEAMNNSPLIINNQSNSAWPHDNTEVITIISPPVTAIFDDLLASFRSVRATTGSRFKRKTCGLSVSCMSIDSHRDVVDWLEMMW